MEIEGKKAFFTRNLLLWNKKKNKRVMPWKGEKDPYKIWLSEIILQQTRVEQGWEYYNRFLKAYPTVKKLANAPEEKVFKLWEGLGYYSRCKNLIATARFIAKEKNGKFPDIHEEILALKGVGPYTAAAIASFAFDLPHAVVDGNVFRVLSRYFGISNDINSSAGKKTFTSLANELLQQKQPGIYNQAIMDFGAVVCKPQKPLCAICPLKKECVALSKNIVEELPVKAKQSERKKRWFYYLIVEHEGKVYVHKRGKSDIWENLYEFILLETGKANTIEKIRLAPLFKKLTEHKAEIKAISKLYLQHLSHQTIQGRFIHISIKKTPVLEGFEAVSFSKLAQLPFPRFITRYLTESGYKALER
ncbi:MAG: A/G-specific adenine glycosylase [Chitinophagaceae bacterium]|nr:A/G-specific adenine glycosylase [Chitinophagaceae bacterium]